MEKKIYIHSMLQKSRDARIQIFFYISCKKSCNRCNSVTRGIFWRQDAICVVTVWLQSNKNPVTIAVTTSVTDSAIGSVKPINYAKKIVTACNRFCSEYH